MVHPSRFRHLRRRRPHQIAVQGQHHHSQPVHLAGVPQCGQQRQTGLPAVHEHRHVSPSWYTGHLCLLPEGRDVPEGTREQVWDNINRYNSRIICSEGYWDYSQYHLPSEMDFVCTGWNKDIFYYVPEYSNAFCGYQDQETFIVPKWYDMDLGNTYDTFYHAQHLV